MTTLNIGGKDYQLRLTTRNAIMLEKALGKSPMTIFMGIENNEIPTIQDLLTILHYCLQSMNANMDMNKVYDLYDTYVSEGHNVFDLVPLFIDCFKDCGYIGKEEAKN